MKQINLKETARKVRWTTEHTLTDSQLQEMLTKKLARARQYQKLTRPIRVKLKT